MIAHASSAPKHEPQYFSLSRSLPLNLHHERNPEKVKPHIIIQTSPNEIITIYDIKLLNKYYCFINHISQQPNFLKISPTMV